MATVTVPQFITVTVTLRRPSLLERCAGIMAHLASFCAGKLLAQSNEFRAIAWRNELEAEMSATLEAGRRRSERAIAETNARIANLGRFAVLMGETPIQPNPVRRHVARGDLGRFRKRNRAAERFSATDLAWFRSPAGDR